MLSGMKGDKASGPDEFSISFFKKCWDIVKNDLLEVFEEFCYSEEFYEHLNDTFWCLLLKTKMQKS